MRLIAMTVMVAATLATMSGPLHADPATDAAFLQSLPSLKEFKNLSAPLSVKMASNNLAIVGVRWQEERTVLIMHVSNGTIHYNKKWICTSGFLWCSSGYDEDHRLRIVDDTTKKEFYIHEISGYPRNYKENEAYTDKNGNKGYRVVEKSRDSVFFSGINYEKTNYEMIFNGVPQSTLRKFSVTEGYCNNGNEIWSICNIDIRYFTEELKEQEDILNKLKAANLATKSMETLDKVYNKYAKYDGVRNYVAQTILDILDKNADIDPLAKFAVQYASHGELAKSAVSKIFSRVKAKDSVAGYEWFIENYRTSPDVKAALERIHGLMFAKARSIDTLAAYNSFVFSYPSAKQVSEANAKADDIETKTYTDFGFFSFLNKEKEMEKKARALLIQAKQIEHFPRDNNLQEEKQLGYLIVANRMYQLLQREFVDSDATLRYLESQDFKDFVKDFKSAMSNITSTLRDISSSTDRTSRYAETMLAVSRQGFQDAKADRAMAEFHTAQHRDWEKQVQWQSKRP